MELDVDADFNDDLKVNDSFSLSNLTDEIDLKQDPTYVSQMPQNIVHQELEVSLTNEQAYALDQIKQGNNVFITGMSGTGKSFMIPVIVRELEKLGDFVAITSACRQGAMNINGQTIQFFSGLDKLDDDWEIIKKKVLTKTIQNIWTSIDAIILDDVNFLSPDHFKKLVFISQNTGRKKTLQWIVLGDFLGLAPSSLSSKRSSNDNSGVSDGDETAISFCFQLDFWSKFFHKTIYLTRNFRQEMDAEYNKLVEDIRKGGIDRMVWAASFNQRMDQPHDLTKDGPVTKLFTKYESVCSTNEDNYRRLRGKEFQYISQKGYQIGNKVYPLYVPKTLENLYKDVIQIIQSLSVNDFKKKKLIKFLEQNSLVEHTVRLKKGATVILMVHLNHQFGLVRGAQGVVTGFTESTPHFPVVSFSKCKCVVKPYMWSVHFTKETKMWYSQIPLRLGWAHSVHKLRGMTLENTVISMSELSEHAQCYEVFSKITSLNKINLLSVSLSVIRAHDECIQFYNSENTIKWIEDFHKWQVSSSKKRKNAESKSINSNSSSSSSSSSVPVSSTLVKRKKPKVSSIPSTTISSMPPPSSSSSSSSPSSSSFSSSSTDNPYSLKRKSRLIQQKQNSETHPTTSNTTSKTTSETRKKQQVTTTSSKSNVEEEDDEEENVEDEDDEDGDDEDDGDNGEDGIGEDGEDEVLNGDDDMNFKKPSEEIISGNGDCDDTDSGRSTSLNSSEDDGV